ncbi:host attachment family protein [Frigidibacter sp. SD6-1]|uniref:host attachment family protein n=1 Tax=Frigidibacter sp. SD6-1 TaxID=3032581 RepID=UPI0024E00690|nr:host attachment family protein [Frigidibacter sp. SD6-1]
MTRIGAKAWVLIADGEKALFLENVGDARDLHLQVVRKETQSNPPSAEQGTDRPGRMSDGPSGHRSALDDTDWHELGKHRFAKDLARDLYRYALDGRFSEIVIVAAPAVLGDLRKELHEEVLSRIVAEIPKTLTGHPVQDIEKLLTTETG